MLADPLQLEEVVLGQWMLKTYVIALTQQQETSLQRNYRNRQALGTRLLFWRCSGNTEGVLEVFWKHWMCSGGVLRTLEVFWRCSGNTGGVLEVFWTGFGPNDFNMSFDP